ncbi:hypothetical protein LBMAG57_29230 [Verrucomicrobiota bacterium]|nr:hypothetical protein LBMAG57_29230 [Verrucomicrobiota bacterium]
MSPFIRKIGGSMDRRYLAWCIAIAAVLHLYALVVFGSVFGIDSSVYAALAESLTSGEQMRAFYTPSTVVSCSHVSCGTPILWKLSTLLPTKLAWPAFALFQHALAAFATVLATITAHRIVPSRWHLAVLALVSLHPYFQWAHNALMSESGALSLMLIGLTLAVRIQVFAPRKIEIAGILLTIVAAAQFRSYLGGFIAAAAGLSFFFARWPWRQRFAYMAALGGAVAAGALAFPVQRYLLTGQFFLPQPGANWLPVASFINWKPSPDAVAQLNAHGWPKEPPAEKLTGPGIGYDVALDIGVRWMKEEGLTLPQVTERARALARILIADRPDAWLIRTRCALLASGFNGLAFAGPSRGPVYWDRSLSQLRSHNRKYYKRLIWMEKASYRPDGEGYFKAASPVPGSAGVGHRVGPRLWAALEPYVSSLRPRWRDPLFLSSLPLDLWTIFGIAGLGVCIVRRPAIGLTLGVVAALHFLLYFLIALGSARYSYPLLSCYFFSTCLGGALALPSAGKMERWRRKRAKKLILGAGGTTFTGWYATDRETLDVLKREDFRSHWKASSRDAFLAEHVWEHFTADDAAIAVRNVFEFLRPGGRLRLAVPDGRNPDPQYLEHVRPGGSGPGADDHKVLWTVESLRQLLLDAGFQVVALEYWDAAGHFHAEPWSSADGHVRRSKRFDPRNQDGTIRYTSLVIDGIKPQVAS